MWTHPIPENRGIVGVKTTPDRPQSAPAPTPSRPHIDPGSTPDQPQIDSASAQIEPTSPRGGPQLEPISAPYGRLNTTKKPSHPCVRRWCIPMRTICYSAGSCVHRLCRPIVLLWHSQHIQCSKHWEPEALECRTSVRACARLDVLVLFMKDRFQCVRRTPGLELLVASTELNRACLEPILGRT